MFESFWTHYIGSLLRPRHPSRDPCLFQDEWLYECTHLLADPDFIKYNPCYAELAKKRLLDYHSLHTRCIHDWMWATKKEEDRVTADEVATAMLDVCDYVEKIKAAKENIHSKKDE